MTEAEWFACADPHPMLALLRSQGGDRKFRLFATGCCRAVWPMLTEKSKENPPVLLEHERRVVAEAARSLEVAEQYADGLVGSEAMVTAYCDLLHLLFWRRPEQEPWAFFLVAALRSTATGACFYGQPWEHRHHDMFVCVNDAATYIARIAEWVGKSSKASQTMQQIEAAIVRCLFGNPFRPTTVDPAWSTPTVVSLARSIYDGPAFGRLPLLADALEDAGCANAEILAHCRGPGPHVRGCWAIDLLLGKE